MTKNGVEFQIGWRDFPLDKNIRGSLSLIYQVQNTWLPNCRGIGKHSTKSKRQSNFNQWLTRETLGMRRMSRHKYVTNSLVLTFIHTFMKNLGEHGSIKNPCFVPPNPRCEFPVSSDHESIKTARLSIRQDLQDRWVTNLYEDRKFFFLIALLSELNKFESRKWEMNCYLLLSLIDKARSKYKNYIWVSMWWKNKPSGEESICLTYKLGCTTKQTRST
jgi:hypothetical protein